MFLMLLKINALFSIKRGFASKHVNMVITNSLSLELLKILKKEKTLIFPKFFLDFINTNFDWR